MFHFLPPASSTRKRFTGKRKRQRNRNDLSAHEDINALAVLPRSFSESSASSEDSDGNFDHSQLLYRDGNRLVRILQKSEDSKLYNGCRRYRRRDQEYHLKYQDGFHSEASISNNNNIFDLHKKTGTGKLQTDHQGGTDDQEQKQPNQDIEESSHQTKHFFNRMTSENSLYQRRPSRKFERVQDDQNSESTYSFEHNDSYSTSYGPYVPNRLHTQVYQYGSCGIGQCGRSLTYGFISYVLKLLYILHFFCWVAIFTCLSICCMVSLVYAAWLSQSTFGMTAIIVSCLPTINLLWILMSFTWHILCLGVLQDFHQLSESINVITDFSWKRYRKLQKQRKICLGYHEKMTVKLSERKKMHGEGNAEGTFPDLEENLIPEKENTSSIDHNIVESTVNSKERDVFEPSSTISSAKYYYHAYLLYSMLFWKNFYYAVYLWLPSLTSLLVNLPVILSFISACLQWSLESEKNRTIPNSTESDSDGNIVFHYAHPFNEVLEIMVGFQFWTSMTSIIILCVLFFIGSLLCEDRYDRIYYAMHQQKAKMKYLHWLESSPYFTHSHSSSSYKMSKSSEKESKRSCLVGGYAKICLYRLVGAMESWWRGPIGEKLRIYISSAFVAGGVYNETGTNWGAAEYEPTYISLDDDPCNYENRKKKRNRNGSKINQRTNEPSYQINSISSPKESTKVESTSSSVDTREHEDDDADNPIPYNKSWCTPWYLGYYLGLNSWIAQKRGAEEKESKSRSKSSQHTCLTILIKGPWIVTILFIFFSAFLVALTQKNVTIVIFISVYFVLLPLVYYILHVISSNWKKKNRALEEELENRRPKLMKAAQNFSPSRKFTTLDENFCEEVLHDIEDNDDLSPSNVSSISQNYMSPTDRTRNGTLPTPLNEPIILSPPLQDSKQLGVSQGGLGLSFTGVDDHGTVYTTASSNQYPIPYPEPLLLQTSSDNNNSKTMESDAIAIDGKASSESPERIEKKKKIEDTQTSILSLYRIDKCLIAFLFFGMIAVGAIAASFLGIELFVINICANIVLFTLHIPIIRRKVEKKRKTKESQLIVNQKNEVRDLKKSLNVANSSTKQAKSYNDREEQQSFYVKSLIYKCLVTARQGSFITIIFVLILVFIIMTVPESLTKDVPQSALNSQTIESYNTDDTIVSSAPFSEEKTLNENLVSLQYPLCNFILHEPASGGQDATVSGLTILDLAYMSSAAYYENETEAIEYVNNAIHKYKSAYNFNGTLVDLDTYFNYSYSPSLYTFQDDQNKVLVISVRGTFEVFDVFQDMDIWFEAMTLQLASYLIPLYGSPLFQPILDKYIGSTSAIVNSLSWLKGLLFSNPTSTFDNRYYYNQVENYLYDVLDISTYNAQGFQIFLTGHSLGGGVSEIVGARLQIPSITFSSPGVVMSRHKFDISLEDINTYTLNIVPEGDAIPMFDIQGILAQKIRCEEDKVSVPCHSLLKTIDEIESNCNYNYNYNYNSLLYTSGWTKQNRDNNEVDSNNVIGMNNYAPDKRHKKRWDWKKRFVDAASLNESTRKVMN